MHAPVRVTTMRFRFNRMHNKSRCSRAKKMAANRLHGIPVSRQRSNSDSAGGKGLTCCCKPWISHDPHDLASVLFNESCGSLAFDDRFKTIMHNGLLSSIPEWKYSVEFKKRSTLEGDLRRSDEPDHPMVEFSNKFSYAARAELGVSWVFPSPEHNHIIFCFWFDGPVAGFQCPFDNSMCGPMDFNPKVAISHQGPIEAVAQLPRPLLETPAGLWEAARPHWDDVFRSLLNSGRRLRSASGSSPKGQPARRTRTG